MQINDLHEPLLHGICHALLPEHADGLPEESLISGLAEVLYEADEALIARALFNLDTRLATSVPVFYALLPAVNGASAWLLARRYADESPLALTTMKHHPSRPVTCAFQATSPAYAKQQLAQEGETVCQRTVASLLSTWRPLTSCWAQGGM